MTNKDYLLKALSKFQVSEDDIDVILAEGTLNPTSPLDLKACRMAIYKNLSNILPIANISEGSYSISWNIEAVKLYYNQLCAELGLRSALSAKVKNSSNRW
jgi:hypothetical protein